MSIMLVALVLVVNTHIHDFVALILVVNTMREIVRIKEETIMNEMKLLFIVLYSKFIDELRDFIPYQQARVRLYKLIISTNKNNIIEIVRNIRLQSLGRIMRNEKF